MAYKDWPQDAIKLARNAWLYGGQRPTAEIVWILLAAPGDYTTESGTCWGRFTVEDTYPTIVLSQSDRMVRGSSVSMRVSRYWARDALVWLLFTKTLPFVVPRQFIGKIRTDIDNDTLWFVLADWLEEQGGAEHAAHLRGAIVKSAL